MNDADKKVLSNLLEKYNDYIIKNAIDDISKEKWESGQSERQIKRAKSKIAYESKKLKNKEVGEALFAKLKPGMVIQVRGTQDGKGFREVLEVESNKVVCRKLNQRWNSLSSAHIYKRDKYITTHGVDKIAAIVEFATIKK